VRSSPAWLTALALSVLAPPLAAREQPLAIGVSAGVHLPSDDGHERVYGSPATFSAEIGSQLNASDTWLDASIGARHASGPEYTVGPTFEVDDASLWVVPATLGLRVNMARAEGARPDVRVYAGAGIALAWAHLSPPDGLEGLDEASSGFAAGFYLELRPEARISGDWNLFARARAEILGNVELEHAGELNPGGGRFQVGVSRWIR
jgi:hypothetical protein